MAPWWGSERLLGQVRRMTPLGEVAHTCCPRPPWEPLTAGSAPRARPSQHLACDLMAGFTITPFPKRGNLLARGVRDQGLSLPLEGQARGYP